MNNKEREPRVEKKPSYPYGSARPTVKAIERLLDPQSSVENVNDKVLSRWGIQRDPYKIKGALKFLGLIDDTDNITPEVQTLRSKKGRVRQADFGDIIVKKYGGEIVDIVISNPDRVSKANQYFTSQEGVPAEEAKKAARILVYLCRFSGMAMMEKAVEKKPRPTSLSVEVSLPLNEVREVLGERRFKKLGELGGGPLIIPIKFSRSRLKQEIGKSLGNPNHK